MAYFQCLPNEQGSLGRGKGSSTNAAADKEPEEQAGASRQDRHHIWYPAGGLEYCQKETDMENWKSPIQKSGTGHPGIIGYVF